MTENSNMNKILFNLFLGILSSWILPIEGSVVILESNPTSIKPSFTRTLTLFCGVNDTTTTVSGALVGRDVTSSPNNMKHLTSLVVIRQDGTHVASATPFDASKPLVDKANLKVKDNIFGSQAGSGFIELTWTEPTKSQAGIYTCEANGISEAGHNIVLSKNFELVVGEVSVEDLVQRLHEHESKDKVMQSTINDLLVKGNNLQNEVNRLNKNNSALQHQVDDLKIEINRYHHIETGIVACGGINAWVSGDHYQRNIVTLKFKTAYQKAPIVHLGMVDLANQQSSYSTYIMFNLKSVSTQGFTVECKTSVGHTINHASANWISVPV